MKTVIDSIIEELTKEKGYCQKAPAMAIERAIAIVREHEDQYRDVVVSTYRKAYKEGRTDEHLGFPNVDLSELYYKEISEDESMG